MSLKNNVLDIYIGEGATSGYVTISNPIPRQTLNLKSYRIEFDTTAHALACEYIKFVAPCFQGNSLLSAKNTTNTGYESSDINGLVVFVDNAKVTLQQCDISISLSKDITENFDFSIFGKALTGFASAHFIFEYSVGQIV